MKFLRLAILLLCCLPLQGQYLVPHGPRGGFSPPDLANLLLWLKADAGVSTDGAGVYEWQDQSGNGNDFAQAGDDEKPALTPAYQNGFPAVTGDGADDYLAHASTATFPSTGFSLFLVLGAAETAYVAGGTTSVHLIQRNASRPRIVESGASLVFGTATWPSADATLVEFHATGTQTHCFVNGTQVGLEFNASNDFILKTLFSFAPGSGESVANWGEWVGYSATITGSERTDVRTYLNDKWAIY